MNLKSTELESVAVVSVTNLILTQTGWFSLANCGVEVGSAIVKWHTNATKHKNMLIYMLPGLSVGF